MKKLLLSFLTLTAVSLFAQDAEHDQMMQAWQESMTPGAMHKLLAENAGSWRTDITTWEDPAVPTKSEGTSEYEMIMDGRYLVGKHTGNFGGMMLDGMEITGYDNAKKKFFSIWIDNFGTGVLHQEGTYDESNSTITFTGTSTDPMGNEVEIRQIVKKIDENTSTMEMYMIQDGKETKWMDMKSSRVK